MAAAVNTVACFIASSPLLLLDLLVYSLKRERRVKTVTALIFFYWIFSKVLEQSYDKLPLAHTHNRGVQVMTHGSPFAAGRHPVAYGVEQRGAGRIRAVDPARL
jgi:hypothetical protein